MRKAKEEPHCIIQVEDFARLAATEAVIISRISAPEYSASE